MLAYVELGIVALLLIWVALLYNRFVRHRNLLREAWSGIDVQLKLRHDLVPRLVDSVKGYRAYEKSLLKNVAYARSLAQAAQGIQEAGKAENGLAQILRTFFAIAEAYPELKANQNFHQLNTALVQVEDQLQYARRYYNGAVRDYNILVESFPSRLIARLFAFNPAVYFEIESSIECQTPEVRL